MVGPCGADDVATAHHRTHREQPRCVKGRIDRQEKGSLPGNYSRESSEVKERALERTGDGT